tara:strand:+ start:321 stop:1073 length:753 start_codon:yes stop_codon:yes gene_type:complete
MKKKQKYSNEEYIIYGINGCLNLLKTKKAKILSIDIMQSSQAEKNNHIKHFSIYRKHLKRNFTKEQFLKKYPKIRSQGIVIRLSYNSNISFPNYSNRKGDLCLLMIDNIEDPQNLGQIVRTAECCGVQGIIIPKHRSVGVTSTVLQVSQGAFLNLPIYISTNLRNDIKILKKQGFWSVALENSINAEKWHNIDLRGKILIVIGGEGKGVRKLIMKECDFQATIPMQGKINSLNVSAAASAILCERLRQIN